MLMAPVGREETQKKKIRVFLLSFSARSLNSYAMYKKYWSVFTPVGIFTTGGGQNIITTLYLHVHGVWTPHCFSSVSITLSWERQHLGKYLSFSKSVFSCHRRISIWSKREIFLFAWVYSGSCCKQRTECLGHLVCGCQRWKTRRSSPFFFCVVCCLAVVLFFILGHIFWLSRMVWFNAVPSLDIKSCSNWQLQECQLSGCHCQQIFCHRCTIWGGTHVCEYNPREPKG